MPRSKALGGSTDPLGEIYDDGDIYFDPEIDTIDDPLADPIA
jgi:hypothetical protein